MNLTQQIFLADYVDSVSYVDRAAEADIRDVFNFLLAFYQNPIPLLGTIAEKELEGGLKAISYAAGFQSQIFTHPGVTTIAERLNLLEASYRFFLTHLSVNPRLSEPCWMWWNDLALSHCFGAPTSEDALEGSILQAKLLEVLLRGLYDGNDAAQAGALHGLEALRPPKLFELLQQFLVRARAPTPALLTKVEEMLDDLEASRE